MADNSLSRSQQLLADMDAKYGKTSSSAPVEPVATPPVQPAPQPAAKKPGGMLEGAMNLIGNRNKQIDKAAGYACGGKVKAHADGGKVSSSKDNEKSILIGAAEVAGNSIMKAAKGAGEMMRWATGGPPPVRYDNPPPYVDSENPTKQKQYASGGKVKPRAAAGAKVDASGKISGPGTATSDSIPAKISPTGEDILVANGERIISVEQDQLLERIAQMLGFDTVDAMFEQMTGKPVGPSMKDGMMAAADGASIYDPTYEALKKIPGAVLPNTTAVYNEAGKDVGDAMSKGNYGNAFGLATRGMLATGAGLVDDVVGGAYRGAKQMLSPVVSGVLGNVDQANPSAQQGQQGITTPASTQAMKPGSGTPAQSPAPAQPVQRGRDANGVITAESLLASSGNDMQRSGGVFGTYDGKGVNDILARENKARGEMIDSMANANGPSGAGFAALPDNATLPGGGLVSDWNNTVGMSSGDKAKYMLARQGVDNKRYETDVQAQRAAGHDQVLMRGQDVTAAGHALQYGNPLDTRKKQLEVGNMEDIAGLRGKVLAGDKDAAATLNALSGKDYDKDRYHSLPNRKVYNDMGQVIDEVSGGLFDKRTGQMVQTGATQKPKQFTAGQTYTDANGNKAIYQKDGTWKEVK